MKLPLEEFSWGFRGLQGISLKEMIRTAASLHIVAVEGEILRILQPDEQLLKTVYTFEKAQSLSSSAI